MTERRKFKKGDKVKRSPLSCGDQTVVMKVSQHEGSDGACWFFNEEGYEVWNPHHFMVLVEPAPVPLAEPVSDPVNHPAHYTQGGIECLDAIQAALTPEEFRGYCKGNALKCVWRERHKGGMEDIDKASFYLDRLKAKS